MIDFYTWSTPNGYKIAIMLEEIKLPYQTYPIDISQGQQLTPEFLQINPNNKIPAIVDQQGPDGKAITIFESGAILIYLAEKTGQLLSKDARARIKALQWLMFQVGGLGPMFGQLHYFKNFASEKIDYAIERYSNEVKRIYTVLNKHLATTPYLADEYSIADIATFPWVYFHPRQGINLDDYPHVKRWHDVIYQRKAVQKGLTIPAAQTP